MKKVFALMLLLLGSLTMVACNGEEEVEEDPDEEDVQAAADELSLPDMDEVLMDFWVAVDGPYDTTVSWESDNPDRIAVTDDEEDGEVRLAVTPVEPGDGYEWVGLTATITKGEASATEDFEVRVDEIIDPDDIQDDIAGALDVEVGEPVGVEGIVTNITSNNTFYIQDDTAAIGVYDFEEEIVPDLNIGDRIEIVGERDEFHGLRQIGFIDWFEITETGVELPPITNLDDVDIEDPDAMLEHQGKYVEMNDMVIEEMPDEFDPWGTIELRREADDKVIDIFYDSRIGCDDLDDAITELEEDDVINITGLTVGWYNEPQLLPGTPDQFEIVE